MRLSLLGAAPGRRNSLNVIKGGALLYWVTLTDELLTRVALHWPDLGNQWNHVDWRLTPVNEAHIASCLHDLLFPTYVFIMPGLLRGLSHRPHGLLEVAHGDTCHVRATALPPRINLPILQEILSTFCRRGWPMVRCTGMHNGVALTDELQDCSPGFFVEIFVAGVMPAHAMDITRWCAELVHLDYQAYSGDLHLFTVGVAHGLTLLASSAAQCWGDLATWNDWLPPEMRTWYLSLCGRDLHFYHVHASIYDVEARYNLCAGGARRYPSCPRCSGESPLCATSCGWVLRRGSCLVSGDDFLSSDA